MSFLNDIIANEWSEDGDDHSPQRRKVNLIGGSLEDDLPNRRMNLRLGSTTPWKGSARVASTGDLAAVRTDNNLIAGANGSINASGIDGVTDLALGQIVLVRAEAAAADNGLYKLADLGSASSPWVMQRAENASRSKEVTTGLTTYIEEGTILGGTTWRLTTTATIALNVTALVFESITVTPHADVSSGPYSANVAQRVLLCDSTGGSFTVTIPPGDSWRGGLFWVKDVGGAAGANNIDVEHDGGTIDGGATFVINTNRRAIALYSDGGTNLHVLSNA